MSVGKAIDALNKKYGKGTIDKVKDREYDDVERQSTGSLLLDFELNGGFPKGRMIEIYGPESSGKTTLCIHAMVEEQKKGGTVAFIDAEQTFDFQYAEALGLDVQELIISQPDNGEQAMEIAKTLIESGEVDMIIVDSVAALTPKAEIDGEVGDSKMGLHARLMSQSCRMITGKMKKSNCTVVFINQLREKIGVMFGSPETTTGGNALKFYASLRLDIRGGQQIKDGPTVVGRQTKITVKKNKTGIPFGVIHTIMTFGKGISKYGELIEIGIAMNIIEKSGSWFKYDGTNIAQGKASTIQALEDNPDLADEIEQIVKNAMENVED